MPKKSLKRKVTDNLLSKAVEDLLCADSSSNENIPCCFDFKNK